MAAWCWKSHALMGLRPSAFGSTGLLRLWVAVVMASMMLRPASAASLAGAAARAGARLQVGEAGRQRVLEVWCSESMPTFPH